MRRPRQRKKKADSPLTPQIISPDGARLYHFRQIPDLPPPRLVAVRQGYLHIDSWCILINPFLMSTLRWFATQITRWLRADPSPEAKAQISGMLDALETAALKFGLYEK